jgi:hypothetical protein
MSREPPSALCDKFSSTAARQMDNFQNVETVFGETLFKIYSDGLKCISAVYNFKSHARVKKHTSSCPAEYWK